MNTARTEQPLSAKVKLGPINSLDAAAFCLATRQLQLRRHCTGRRHDQWRYVQVVRHRDDGRIVLESKVDGRQILWDLQEHGMLDYGYAVTSFRGQGKTVDDTFMLVTGSNQRRAMYVDLTRARDRVMIAYGEDDVRDFGKLMENAQRDVQKSLILDIMQEEEERKRREALERGRREDRRFIATQTAERDMRGGPSGGSCVSLTQPPFSHFCQGS